MICLRFSGQQDVEPSHYFVTFTLAQSAERYVVLHVRDSEFTIGYIAALILAFCRRNVGDGITFIVAVLTSLAEFWCKPG